MLENSILSHWQNGRCSDANIFRHASRAGLRFWVTLRMLKIKYLDRKLCSDKEPDHPETVGGIYVCR